MVRLDRQICRSSTTGSPKTSGDSEGLKMRSRSDADRAKLISSASGRSPKFLKLTQQTFGAFRHLEPDSVSIMIADIFQG